MQVAHQFAYCANGVPSPSWLKWQPAARRPIVTMDLAVIASASAASARLRDEHLWPVVLDAMTLIREAITTGFPMGSLQR